MYDLKNSISFNFTAFRKIMIYYDVSHKKKLSYLQQPMHQESSQK
jgi:hypothetical protein